MTFLERYVQDARACGVDLWLQRLPHDDELMAWGMTRSGWPLQLGLVTGFDLALDGYGTLLGLVTRAREAQAR